MSSMPSVITEYIEALRTHDVEKIGGTVWDDMVFVSTARTLGKREFLRFLRCLYIAFPDWHYEHDPPEWREDTIAIKWRQGGTHQDVFEMQGIAPVAATHRSVKLPEQFFFYRLRRDEIAEIRPEQIPGGAPSGILRQIGVHVPILYWLGLCSLFGGDGPVDGYATNDKTAYADPLGLSPGCCGSAVTVHEPFATLQSSEPCATSIVR